ncbi:O-antigen ligase family protein [Clostridium sp. YIM B02515]|uniref:O-antigen ligase family protein n=1 Tax=Clostridium rhizosphaerae TaxID=2803861 RepID=A0ABS1TJI3_9CLOT|nr:O-antigen ligase family protein [Clostridium rhizosphaerae]MBL4938123.1 O-antigen ligase family protein [Clostridium rhizosphaerae]
MKNIKKTITFLIYLFVGIELGGLFEIFGVRFGMRNHFIEAGYSLADAYIKRIPVVFFFNPNDYAFYLVIMLIIINVFIMFSEKLKEKLKLLIIFSIGQVNLIFTASRTGWICFILSSIITAFVIFMCNIEKSKKYKYIKSQIILLTYIIIFFFVFSINTISRPYFGKIESIPYVGKIYSINSIKSNDNSNENKNKVDKNNNLELGGKGSNNERYTLIYNVINGIFIKKHYLGYGVGNSVVLEASFNNTNDILNVHSFWFEILADFGVIIFLYLLYIYINLILGLSKLSKKSKNIIFSMFLIINIVSLIILIPLSFASSSIISHTIFWIALGLSYSSIKDKNIQQINV